MRGLLKALKWFGYSLLGLVVLLLGVVVFVATTETGLHWAWTVGRSHLPKGIEIAAVEGQLIGPLELRGLSVNTEAMQLRLAHFSLRWDALALFDGVVRLQEVRLQGLDYTALPTTGEPAQKSSKPFELPKAIDLPVAVVLDALVLENAQIQTAPDAEPIVVDKVRVAATLDDQSWRITTLKASGPLFRVSGGVKVVPRNHYPHAAHLQWRLTPPDLAPLAGHVTVQGDLNQTSAELALEPPYNLHAQASVRNPLQSLAVTAKVRFNKTQLAVIRNDLPPVTLSARARVAGTLQDLGFNVDVTATHPQRGSADLKLIGGYHGNQIHIEKLKVTSPDTPGHIVAHGDIALAAGNAMDLVLQWQDLQWPLQDEPSFTSRAGHFSITGPLEHYRVDGRLRWRLARQEQAGRLQIAGNGSLKGFDLETLAITGAPGELTGQAHVVWAPRLDVTAQLLGRGLNPGAILPDWPGALDLAIELQAAQHNDGLHARLEQLHVDGTLRGQPLTINAAAHYNPTAAVIEQLQLVAGETTLQAVGQVTEPMQLEFELHSDDLGTTLPGAEGQITASGHIRGSYLHPNIVATLAAYDLAYAGNSIEQIALDADIHWSQRNHSTLSLIATNGSFGAMALKRIALQGSGMPEDHKLSLTIDSSEGDVAVALTGDFQQDRGVWDFVLQQAKLAYGGLEPWRLDGAASGQVTATAQRLQQACWTSAGARLCLQGSHTTEGSRGEFSLDAFRLAYLQPLLPERLKIQGSVSAEGQVRFPAGGTPVAEALVHTAAGKLSATNLGGEWVDVLVFESGKIEASLAANGAVNAQVHLPLANGDIRMRAEVAGGEAALAKRSLRGEVSLNLDSLAFLTSLVPEVTAVTGHLLSHYRISGTVGAPEVNGKLKLDAATLSLATPGLDIHDLVIAVIGAGRKIDVRASAESGGGRLAVDGNIALAEAGALVNLQIKGKAFQVLDNRMGSVYASPDLSVKVTSERIDVTGKLHIPEALITPQELPASSGAVTVSGDQVIVRPDQRMPGEVAIGGRQLDARIRLVVGDPDLHLTEFAKRGRNYADVVRRLPGDLVRFEGFGMKAVLVGNLLIVQEPGEPALGSGELRIVAGQYKAYGQDLQLTDSSILFGGGPVAQPALDVRAVRYPSEDVVVGVHVTGRVEQPKLTLFSEPSDMTQSEQLSWLILGRPLSGTSSAESTLIAQAALALGMVGGNALTAKLSDNLGLDHMGLESTGGGSGQQVSLVMGKYLTPKLYVSYGIGLFKPVNTLRLRYTLSKLWALETKSTGVAAGGDIIFSIELP